jgi:hypothetical protein
MQAGNELNGTDRHAFQQEVQAHLSFVERDTHRA